jgi:RNA polymerase sigma-70 factor, ECF subfamily
MRRGFIPAPWGVKDIRGVRVNLRAIRDTIRDVPDAVRNGRGDDDRVNRRSPLLTADLIPRNVILQSTAAERSALAFGPRARGRHAEPGERDAGFGRRLDPESIGSHLSRLCRAAYGLCGSREDAEDLVQDTYERVLRRPRFLRRDDDVAYMLRTLRNTWISTGRDPGRATVVCAGDAIDAIEMPRDPIDQSVTRAAVYDALQALSEPLREALVAVDVVGLSYREAARALGTKEGTIMSRLHRGRGQVAVRLALQV